MFSAVISITACSSKYEVGFMDMPAGNAGMGGKATNPPSSSGGSTSMPVAGSGGIIDPTTPAEGGAPEMPAPMPRCGFMPDAASTSTSDYALPTVVMARILRLVDDSTSAPRGNLPTQVTPEWAAMQAAALLDAHVADKSEPAGLARFLKTWLNAPGANPLTEFTAAHSFSKKLAQSDATLATLLSEPTGEPHRLGILTDPEVLTRHNTISRRGSWLEQRLFCTTVPPSPPNIALPPSNDPNKTRRENLEASLSTPSCNSCHVIMDPVGDSLEHFDAMGQYGTTDAGQPIDSSGTIQGENLSFMSFDDLAPELAQSCSVAHCFSQTWLSDGLATPMGQMPAFSDAELNHVANAFADSNFSIRALVKAIVTSPSFLH